MADSRKRDYMRWTDLRLRQTRAYLQNCIQGGHPAIYDPEEDRLKLDDINAEITRRQQGGEDKPSHQERG